MSFPSISDLIEECKILCIDCNYRNKICRNYFKFSFSNDSDVENRLLQDIIGIKRWLEDFKDLDLIWIPLLKDYLKYHGMKIHTGDGITKIDYSPEDNSFYSNTDFLWNDVCISQQAFERLTNNRLRILIQILNNIGISGLDLSACYTLDKSKIEYLGELKSLKKLNLSWNKYFKKEHITALSSLLNIVDLNVSNCNLMPGDLEDIAKLNKLKRLDISKNELLDKKDIETVLSIKSLIKIIPVFVMYNQ